jgi:hypothetical protein
VRTRAIDGKGMRVRDIFGDQGSIYDRKVGIEAEEVAEAKET